MCKKRKISIILTTIIILQAILPTLNVIFENKLTLKSIANTESEYYINTAEEFCWRD